MAIALKLGSGGLWFLCSTFPLIKVYLPIKFHADFFSSHLDMFHTKFKYKKVTNLAITLKLRSGGLWFLCNALLLDEIYTPLKCHVQICNTLWDIAPTSLWQTDGRTAGRTTPNLYSPAFGGDNKLNALFPSSWLFWDDLMLLRKYKYTRTMHVTKEDGVIFKIHSVFKRKSSDWI